MRSGDCLPPPPQRQDSPHHPCRGAEAGRSHDRALSRAASEVPHARSDEATG